MSGLRLRCSLQVEALLQYHTWPTVVPIRVETGKKRTQLPKGAYRSARWARAFILLYTCWHLEGSARFRLCELQFLAPESGEWQHLC